MRPIDLQRNPATLRTQLARSRALPKVFVDEPRIVGIGKLKTLFQSHTDEYERGALVGCAMTELQHRFSRLTHAWPFRGRSERRPVRATSRPSTRSTVSTILHRARMFPKTRNSSGFSVVVLADGRIGLGAFGRRVHHTAMRRPCGRGLAQDVQSPSRKVRWRHTIIW